MPTTEIPNLLILRPKMAQRTWFRFLVDHDDYPTAEALDVTMALQELDLNFGKEAEGISAKNLADKLNAFKAALGGDE